MHREVIEFVDYDGNERKEEFYFNLTKSELLDMETRVVGGFKKIVQRIIDTQDIPKLCEIFKEVIHKSYGVKSPDGRRFMKSKEILDDFIQTEAYNKLYYKLATNAKEAAAFINAVIPTPSDVNPASETNA